MKLALAAIMTLFDSHYETGFGSHYDTLTVIMKLTLAAIMTLFDSHYETGFGSHYLLSLIESHRTNDIHFL